MALPLLNKTIQRFVQLTDEEYQQVLSYTTERKFKRGGFINTEGQVNRYTNFVTTGSARSYFIDQHGNEHIIQLAIAGWWIGDYISFITQQPGTLYTVALEPIEMLSISFDDLERMYIAVPKMERFFRLLVQRAYAAFHTRTLQNLSFDAEQRYLAFREAYPDMDMQISQKHVASYLGMSPEFLSKIKKRIVQKQRHK